MPEIIELLSCDWLIRSSGETVAQSVNIQPPVLVL